MKLKVSKTTYALELTPEQMDTLCGKLTYDDIFSKVMSILCAAPNIDYDYHFGRYIYLEIDGELTRKKQAKFTKEFLKFLDSRS